MNSTDHSTTSEETARLREASRWWLQLQEDPERAPAAEWLAWSQKNPANLDAFDRIESTALELRRLDPGQRAELIREFASAGRGNPAGSRWRFAAAACLAACLLAGLGYLYLSGVPFGVWTGVATGDAVYSTERALHQNITLADGSQVTVGASSVVIVRMREHERHIQLRDGEAYFEVRKDPARPFVVESGDITITAVGTAFNVRRTGADVTISVTEGRVRVAQPAGGAVEVNAGERVTYAPRAHRFQLTAISPERATAWRERRLEFVNEPLAVVIANVNRYVSPQLSISDGATAQLTFTGTVLPENLSAWLGALPKVLPVRVHADDSAVQIHAAD